LEGTGALVLDRLNKIGYAVISERCNKKLVELWGQRLGYKMVLFYATDSQHRPIYHTNVMMAVGTTFAVICLESIDNETERQLVVDALKPYKDIIEITRDQMNNLCGNVLEVQNTKGEKLCVMSTKAYVAFTEAQKEKKFYHMWSILFMRM